MNEEETIKIMLQQYKLIKELISYIECCNISDNSNISRMSQEIETILSRYTYVLSPLRESCKMLTIDLVYLADPNTFDVSVSQEIINDFITRWNKIAIKIRQKYNI